MPSTIRWRGDAPKVAQVTTVQITAYDASTTYEITMNGKVVSTAGTGGTASTTAAALQVLLAASTVPEFVEAVWTVDTDTITATARTAGVPFTFTSSVSGGTGTVGAATDTTANSGPNDIGLAANYSGGVLPATGDTLVFENSNVDFLYNIDALAAVTLAACYQNASYTGKIGLPKTNPGGYAEYRPSYFQVGATALYVGRGTGSGSGRSKWDTGSVQTTIYLDGTGSSSETGLPAFQWKGTHASNALYATKGTFGACLFAGETATLAVLDVGYAASRAGDVDFQAGTGLTWTTAKQTGGKVALNSGGTTYTQTGGKATVSAGNITSVNVRDDKNSNATFVYNGAGTVSALKASGPVAIDWGQSQQACTVSAADLYGPVTWNDPNQRVTLSDGLDCNETGLGLDDGPKITRGRNYKITFGAVS
jgi:hypothetical protein